jgi:hypothetical protein
MKRKVVGIPAAAIQALTGVSGGIVRTGGSAVLVHHDLIQQLIGRGLIS